MKHVLAAELASLPPLLDQVLKLADDRDLAGFAVLFDLRREGDEAFAVGDVRPLQAEAGTAPPRRQPRELRDVSNRLGALVEMVQDLLEHIRGDEALAHVVGFAEEIDHWLRGDLLLFDAELERPLDDGESRSPPRGVAELSFKNHQPSSG